MKNCNFYQLGTYSVFFVAFVGKSATVVFKNDAMFGDWKKNCFSVDINFLSEKKYGQLSSIQ